jgi:hypothetical protein
MQNLKSWIRQAHRGYLSDPILLLNLEVASLIIQPHSAHIDWLLVMISPLKGRNWDSAIQVCGPLDPSELQ